MEVHLRLMVLVMKGMETKGKPSSGDPNSLRSQHPLKGRLCRMGLSCPPEMCMGNVMVEPAK